MSYNESFDSTIKRKKADILNALNRFERAQEVFKKDMLELTNAIEGLNSKYKDNIECINTTNSLVINYKNNIEMVRVTLEDVDLYNRTDDDKEFGVTVSHDKDTKIKLVLDTNRKYYYDNNINLKQPDGYFYNDESNNSEKFIERVISILAERIVKTDMKEKEILDV